MPTPPQPESIPAARLWIGLITTGLVTLFMVFDGVTKVIRIAPVLKASEQLGLPVSSIVPIGIVLLACTAIYVVPQTAILGAILLTGYFGGAVAIHVRASSGPIPICFSIIFSILVWIGLVLREPRLGWLVALRRW